MGSEQTLSALWAQPGEFAYIGAMSAFGSPPAGTDVDAVNAGPHGWDVWQKSLIDFLPRLFTSERTRPGASRGRPRTVCVRAEVCGLEVHGRTDAGAVGGPTTKPKRSPDTSQDTEGKGT